MSLRFRRRIKLLPGVHLNISRSGISTSVGVRGASMTFGKLGTYVNTGITGSGISWRSRVAAPQPSHAASVTNDPPKVTISSAETSAPTIEHHHHLHWWKVLLFVASMVAAGATHSNTIIGIWWLAWFAYWGFLFVRLVVRMARQSVSKPVTSPVSGTN